MMYHAERPFKCVDLSRFTVFNLGPNLQHKVNLKLLNKPSDKMSLSKECSISLCSGTSISILHLSEVLMYTNFISTTDRSPSGVRCVQQDGGPPGS